LCGHGKARGWSTISLPCPPARSDATEIWARAELDVHHSGYPAPIGPCSSFNSLIPAVAAGPLLLQFNPHGYETGGQDHRNKQKANQCIMHCEGPRASQLSADEATIGSVHFALHGVKVATFSRLKLQPHIHPSGDGHAWCGLSSQASQPVPVQAQESSLAQLEQPAQEEHKAAEGSPLQPPALHR
jgi:hypothetical protein